MKPILFFLALFLLACGGGAVVEDRELNTMDTPGLDSSVILPALIEDTVASKDSFPAIPDSAIQNP